MKRLSLRILSLVLTLLTSYNVFAQTTGQPVQYSLTLDPDGTYKVWMKSMTGYTGNNAKIGTAQVTVVVPTATNFVVTNLTGANGMTWTTTAQSRINNPTANGTPTNKDYIVFNYVNSTNLTFDIAPNTDIQLFSFKNQNTCAGPIALWDVSDPYQVPNLDNFNVGNQIAIFGAGFGNKWHSNYGTSPVPCNAPPAPNLEISVTPPATITQNSPATFAINVSNIGTGATTGTTTVTTPIPAGMTYVGSSGTDWTCNQVVNDIVCTNPNSIAPSGSSPYSLTFTPTTSGSGSITSTVSGGGDPTPSTSPTSNFTVNPATPSCLVEYKITLETDGSYKVWMRSNTTFTGTAATIGTAQATVVFPMPSGSTAPVISNLTGFNNMTWTTGSTQMVQQGNFYYVVFNFNQSTSPTVFNITAGQEIPLFSFKNTGTCNGPVSLWTSTDAFQVPNPINFNVGNQISINGAGFGNKWCSNYGSAADCPATGNPTLAISVTAPATGTLNVPYNYNINVSNTGTAPTTGTSTVTLPLPSGFNYTGVSGTGWTCSQIGTNVVCNNPNPIANGASSQLAVSVTPTVTGTINTFAYVQGGGTNTTAFSTLVSTTITSGVNTQPNIVITSVTNPSTGTVGSPINIAINISNIGTAPSSGTLSFTSTLPVGINFSSVNSGWNCTQVGQQLTCTTSSVINNGSSFPLNIQLLPTSPLSFTLSGTLTGTGVSNGSVAGTQIVISNPTTNCTATDCGQGVRYGIKLEADGKTYTVYMKSATSYTGGLARISTAQVTLRVPHAVGAGRFVPINLTGIASTGNMVWTTNSNSRVDAPAIDPANDYIFFGYTATANPNVLFDIIAEVEYPLFSFQNQNNCNGNVALWETTDLFQQGNQSLNPGNSMTILGNGNTNAWKCNYTCYILCQQPADLTISASQPSPALSVGQTSTINITVTNLSANTASGQLTVTTTLPAGVSTPSTNFTVGSWTCSRVGQTVTCTNPNTSGLAQNATSVIALPVVPSAANAGQSLTFTFNVSSSSPDSNSGNNSTSLIITSPVTAPNLTINIPNFVLNAGQTSNVTVNVANIGNAPASGQLSVNITIPNGATAPASFTSNGWTCTTAGQNISCTHPNSTGLAPNATVSIVVPVSVPANATGGQSVTIIANVGSINGESNTSDNSTTGNGQVVSGVRLKLFKAASAVAIQGVQFDFTMTVVNIGGINSSGTIIVIDTLRNGLKYVSSTGTGWTCTKTGVDTQNNDIVQCTSSTVHLANSANSSSFTIRVNPTLATTVSNTAYISGGGSTSPTPTASAPCSSCVSSPTIIFVQPAPDLTVVIAQPSPILVVGQLSNINITINNIGGVITNAPLTVNITLPVGMTMPSSFTTGGWSCTTSGQTVTCTNPNTSGIPANGSINFNLPITPPMSMVGTTPTIIVNVLPIPNEISTNNNGGTLIILNPIAAPIVPDLAITISQPVTNLIVNQQSSIPVTITNVGTGTASGQLTVSMTLPTGISVPSSFAQNGWTFTLNGNQLTGTHPNSTGFAPNGTLTFQIPVTPNNSAANTMPIFIMSVGVVNTEINLLNNTAWMIPNVGISNPAVPNLVLTISQNSAFQAGQVANMNINITNMGAANATGPLTVSFIMPSGMSAPSSFNTSGSGWVCTTLGQTVTCTHTNLNGIAPNAQTNITIPVTPNISLVGQIPSVFLGSVNQVPSEIVLIDNTDFYTPISVVTNGGSPNIVINVMNPIPSLVVGQQSIIPVHVINTGNAPTSGNTTINITLPTTLSVPNTFASNGWTCVRSTAAIPNPPVICTFTSPITPFSTTIINIPVIPLQSGSGQPAGSLTISLNGLPPGQPVIIGGGGIIMPAPAPDLMISMLQPLSPLQVGQTGYIPVVVTNVGSVSVNTPLVVSITLPAGIASSPSFVQGAWSCTTSGQTVTCTNQNTLGLVTTSQTGFWIPVTPSNTVVNTLPTFMASVNIVSGETVVINNQTSMTVMIPVQGMIVLPALAADLSIVINQPQTNLSVGQSSPMSIVVSNVGQGAATGQLTVTMVIPNGITVQSGTSNGWTLTVNGNTLTATHPNGAGLASGSSMSFVVNITPNASIINTKPIFLAVVSMAPTEINSLNNTAMMISNIGVAAVGSPNLSITAMLGGVLVVNQQTNLDVSIYNSGSVSATGQLSVTVNLPNGISAPASFSSNGWIGSTFGQTVTLSYPNLTGLSTSGTLTFSIPITPSGILSNTIPQMFTFNVAPVPNEIVIIDNVFYLIPTAPVLNNLGPNIIINFPSVIPTLTVGTVTNFVVNFVNTGTAPLQGQQLINVLIPNGLSVPSSFFTNGWNCTFANQNLACTHPNSSGLPVNGNLNLIIPLTPNNGTAGQIPSPINLYWNSGTTPYIYTFTTPIVGTGSPNLVLNVGSLTSPMIAGQSYYIPITISNLGSMPANGQLTVNVTLPSGMTSPASFVLGGWTCSTVGQTITCIHPNTAGMPTGGGSILMIPVSPGNSLVGSNPSLTITVLPVLGEILTNNNTVVYIINPAIIGATTPDLVVMVSQPSPALTANQNSTINISVQNIGSSPTGSPLTTSFTLPANFSSPNSNFTSNGWTCNVVGQTVTCTHPNTGGLAPNATSTFAVQIRPSNSAVGSTLSMTINVSAVGGETNVGNNSTVLNVNNPVLIDPNSLPNLNLVLTYNQSATYYQNVPFNLSYLVYNSSSTVASNGMITVRDTLRQGLQFVSGTGIGWTINKVGVDAQGNDIIVATFNTPLPSNASTSFTINVNPSLTGTIFNQAYISGGGMMTIIKPSAPCIACTMTPTGPIVINQVVNLNIAVKALLQGAYVPSAGMMYDSLRVKNLIPLNSPYPSAAGTTTASVLSVTGSNAIVDWMMLELRSASNPTQIVATKAALIQRDGDIVSFTDGTSPVSFTGVAPGNYYVSVRHRNHLGVMSATPIALGGTTATLDFSNPSTPAYKLTGAGTTNYPLTISGGRAMLWGGNANGDNQVIFQGPNNDIDAIFFSIISDPLNTQGIANFIKKGYQNTDVNLDGKVVFQGPDNEVDIIFFNVMLHPENSSFLSNFIIWQQLP